MNKATGKFRRRCLAGTCAVALGVGATTAASAQTVAPPASDSGTQNQNPATVPAAPKVPTSSEVQPTDGSTIGDIVVTAQRRSERLQDVPLAITAATGEQLAAAGINNTRDLQQISPSIAFSQQTYSPQPSIRGIGTRNLSIGDESVVPIYVDGVYQPFIMSSVFELASVERIEVLKGPQGTLLGRNATGGAINVITADPSATTVARFMVGYGTYDAREASAYVNGGSDTIAANLAVNYAADDGYVRDIGSGKRVGGLDSFTARGKLRFSPTANTDITLALTYADRIDSSSLAVFAFNGNTIARTTQPNIVLPETDRRVALSFSPYLKTTQRAAGLTIVQRFDAFTLTSISGYASNKLRYHADTDLSPLSISQLTVVQTDKAYTQELYAVSSGTGPFGLTVGGFFMDDKSAFDPVNSNGLIFTAGVDTTAWAAYAQGTYRPVPKLTLTLGGRYSHDKKTERAAGVNFPVALPDTTATFTSFDPSATIDYDFGRAKVFLRYATAYKSGIFNVTAFDPVPVRPEKVKSYEFGIKSDPLPWLRANISAFYTDYNNLQLAGADPNSPIIRVIVYNAAKARIFGTEGDIVISPTRALRITGGFSLLDTKYLSFPGAQTYTPLPGNNGNASVIRNLAGKKLQRVPPVSLTLGAEHRSEAFGGTLTLGSNVYYSNGYSYTPDGLYESGPFATVNAQIGWTTANDRYGITVWGKNLNGSQPPANISVTNLGNQSIYGRPLTAGVRLSAKF